MNDELNNKLDLILKSLNENTSKLNNIEQGLLSINTDLIEQNIKFSNTLLGTVPIPAEIVSTVEKELYYSETNGRIIAHGPGTFDNKDKLKSNGQWDQFKKSWNMNITRAELLTMFPNIINKQL